ncbi:MAG TPA: nucleotidyl transferase AbiEii/AbiGii toxin family protein [Acidobacteriota bacterium]|nr:nucleotidyl transferase AbiEii/AbiGii toxin family protein [Acidobacteriota bacterium]
MPRNSYRTGSAFRAALEERLAQIARRESIDLQRLRRQVAFDRLLARLTAVPGCPWVLKGGYAMELRYRKARSTKDLDFTMRMPAADEAGMNSTWDSIQEAAAADLGDFFTFRIGKATIDVEGAPYGGGRYPVEAVFGGRAFARFHVDIGIGDLVLEPAETVQCRDWLHFAQIPPATVLMISPEQQFAEKLHAYTFPRLKTPNSRVRDLVDMFLLVNSRSLLAERTKEAIQSTFARRRTHPVPPILQPPAKEWMRPFSTLAAECAIHAEVDEAFEIIEAYYRSLCKLGRLRATPRKRSSNFFD